MTRFAGSFGALLMLIPLGCQPAGRVPFAGDLVLPEYGGVRSHEQGITYGDGPNRSHIIFLNFEGATVRPPSTWGDDSAQNISMIPSQTSVVPAFDGAPYGPSLTRTGAINAITNYFTHYYAPFNVQVVTTRPASPLRYTMCLIGGDPSDVQVGGSAAGIAPLDCDNSNEAEVTYAFSDVLSPNFTGSVTDSLKAIAVTAAQETAHSFGLGHTQNQNDIMYPQLTYTATGFAQGAQRLWNDGSGQCSGGSTTQDSYNMLMLVLGASTGINPTNPPPQVAFVAPTSGATVPLSFQVKVSATVQGSSISSVDIQLDGQTVRTLTASPWNTTLTEPQTGSHTVTAIAYAQTGTSASATVNIKVAASAPPQMTGCAGDSDCDSGLVCKNNQCVTPTGTTPAPGEVGAQCAAPSDCHTGLCVTNLGICTAACDPADSASCPDNFECVESSGEHYCVPKSGGGCDASSGRRDSGMLAPLCLLLGLALLRRRRATS